ncbi:hypothetical protein ACG7TL_008275 [Trametes sanguinea]
MAHFPDAPQLPPAALREVFTYPDPTRAPDERNPYSDAGRLELQGEKMAEAAYLDVMMRLNPVSNFQALQHHVQASFPGFVERTAKAYGWNRSVRGYPSNVDRNAPQEHRRLFFTYAGAVGATDQLGYYKLRESSRLPAFRFSCPTAVIFNFPRFESQWMVTHDPSYTSM